ncbi:F-box domain-containing protein [Arthroderma uncinatum]|uniref:F-box domain-containing protein n=1 Tax=Arthroderma uncinatum TaxID=74035 RepID=UPI00144A9A4D|nr:F-box domain-containing protein [Arthroderma uncinatum]KAF3491040.1 F-box domain-containing protein [Arthroderma uncinatum]
MQSAFDAVPFDIWHQVVHYLDPNDYINLSLANSKLYNLLKDEITARKAVKAHIAHTVEGDLASVKEITYREALGRVYDIRESIATAQPYSTSLLAVGQDFLFNQGVVCYISNGQIRTLNLLQAAEFEQVVDLDEAFDPYHPRSKGHRYPDLKYKLLYYNDGIVACLCEPQSRDVAWLLAIDVKLEFATSRKGYRIRYCRPMASTRNLFVRHNRSVMYYGTHSGRARHGHREWVLHGFDFVTASDINIQPIQLDNFAGSEIGSTVCFEIKDRYLYAVSNQTSFEDEEIDWTSYYICVRFPLNKPTDIKWQRIWRRQHREGPINDNWTKLSLRVDHTTRQLNIVECRHEWQNGGSENFRINYSQPLDCFDPAETLEGLLKAAFSTSPAKHGFPKYLPVRSLPDEPLARTLDPFSKPNYEPPRKRLKKFYHLEYTPEEAQSPERRDFTLSNTKYHTYNLMASAFIDIVNDPPQQVKSFTTPPDRLRLRIGSRKRQFQQYEMDEEGESAAAYPPTPTSMISSPITQSDECFKSRGIKMWPANDAPAELLELLCPSKKAGKVVGTSDERFMVYSTDSGLGDGTKAIIMISFDPSIGLKHMKRLNQRPFGRRKPDSEEYGSDADISTAQSMFDTHPEPTWFRVEPAEYLRLDKGLWLR